MATWNLRFKGDGPANANLISLLLPIDEDGGTGPFGPTGWQLTTPTMASWTLRFKGEGPAKAELISQQIPIDEDGGTGPFGPTGWTKL